MNLKHQAYVVLLVLFQSYILKEKQSVSKDDTAQAILYLTSKSEESDKQVS